jgi:hypothetical protein
MQGAIAERAFCRFIYQGLYVYVSVFHNRALPCRRTQSEITCNRICQTLSLEICRENRFSNVKLINQPGNSVDFLSDCRGKDSLFGNQFNDFLGSGNCGIQQLFG